MTDRIEPQPGILQIKLYQGGASHLEGVSEIIKLSSNENPWGASDAARAAFAAASFNLHRYPSTDHADLRAAIAKARGLDADRIICGVGSDEVLTFLCQCYAGPGTEVIYTEHGFSLYPILALAAGATPVVVKEKTRVVDIDAILAAVTQATRLVFIANPANPTGTLLDAQTLRQLADGLPPNVILVLDGAYAEFAEGYDGGVTLTDSHPNVVMTRTFSKLYGLGGLRVGWGYANRDIIDVLNRVRGPFNLGQPQLEAARAAIQDTAFAQTCLEKTARHRTWLTDALRELGLQVDTSHANFVLARFASPQDADACEAHLRAEGILVRKVAGYGFPEGLRITVGDESSCRRVVANIRKWQEGEQ